MLTEQEYLILYDKLKSVVNKYPQSNKTSKRRYYKYILDKCLHDVRYPSDVTQNVRRFIKKYRNIFKNKFLEDVNQEDAVSNLINMIDNLIKNKDYDTTKGFLELKDVLSESKQLVSKAEDITKKSSGISDRLKEIISFIEGKIDALSEKGNVLVMPPVKGFPHAPYPKNEAPNEWNYSDKSDSEIDDIRM